MASKKLEVGKRATRCVEMWAGHCEASRHWCPRTRLFRAGDLLSPSSPQPSGPQPKVVDEDWFRNQVHVIEICLVLETEAARSGREGSGTPGWWTLALPQTGEGLSAEEGMKNEQPVCIKYLIFSPWEVSRKAPYNKYCTGQFHHGARQLMVSFALTDALQMLVLGHIFGGFLS